MCSVTEVTASFAEARLQSAQETLHQEYHQNKTTPTTIDVLRIRQRWV